jgi:dTDP-glucose 4,6-dehydratase
MKVLLTGAAGFVGSHIVSHLLANTDWDIVALDRLNYAGSLERLAEHKGNERLKFVFHDFRAAYPSYVLHQLADVKLIIHNGAESHVDRSIFEPEPFVMSNVLGTMHTLDAAKQLGVEKFIYTSTDEVFGPAPVGVDYKEDDPIRPSNPYAAAKAGGEALCYSYWVSYQLPVIITRTMNLFGEKQDVEKYIPMVIKRVRDMELVKVHGTPEYVGSRKWLHARNQADALLFLLRNGRAGEFYNIAGTEVDNLTLAKLIGAFVGKPLIWEYLDFHSARKGHDPRYSLDDTKLRSLGWQPPLSFDESLLRTVVWTLRPENEKWLASPTPSKLSAVAGN